MNNNEMPLAICNICMSAKYLNVEIDQIIQRSFIIERKKLFGKEICAAYLHDLKVVGDRAYLLDSTFWKVGWNGLEGRVRPSKILYQLGAGGVIETPGAKIINMNMKSIMNKIRGGEIQNLNDEETQKKLIQIVKMLSLDLSMDSIFGNIFR